MDARDKCDKISEIGKCTGCSKMSRLVDHACSACRMQFGPRCGIIYKKIRNDEEFAVKFYRNLDNDIQRETFQQLFGKDFMDYKAALGEQVAEELPKVAHVQTTEPKRVLRLIDRS